jgi:ATP-dependent DNA helicase RecQ
MVTREPVALTKAAGLDPRYLELQLLQWQDEGLLSCRPSARDLLIEVLPEPKDAWQHLSVLLDEYDKVQQQRIVEMVAYATTAQCRHGHISAYFGGRTIQRCSQCDNCVAQPVAGSDQTEDSWQPLLSVLQAGAHGWGPWNMIRILRGSPGAPSKAHKEPYFGALLSRSEGAIGQMVDSLIRADFLRTQPLDKGGAMVTLTPAGRRALVDPDILQAFVKPRAPPPFDRARQTRPTPVYQPRTDTLPPAVEELFQTLRAWRREKARAEGKAPFIVAHDSVLRRIAEARPRSLEELARIKGVGSRKLAQYGAEVVALVLSSHDEPEQ